MILTSMRGLFTDRIFLGILVIGLLGLITDQIFKYLHRWLLPWSPKAGLRERGVRVARLTLDRLSDALPDPPRGDRHRAPGHQLRDQGPGVRGARGHLGLRQVDASSAWWPACSRRATGASCSTAAPCPGPGAERGMVFQSYTLFPWLTVQQNVEFGLRLRGTPPAERGAVAAHYIAWSAWLASRTCTRRSCPAA